MSLQQWLVLAGAALLVFWIVGAYNRLVALRNTIGGAWARVAEALAQRAAAAEALLAALREPLQAERGALERLQAALAEQQRHTQALNTRPVDAAHTAAWAAAEALLGASASRVFALAEVSDGLRAHADVADAAARWREAQQRLVFARALFNDAAAAYDDAITLFPTRLLLPLFRFGRAGRL